MEISELTWHIAATVDGINGNFNTALPRLGYHHPILSPRSKSPIKYGTRVFDLC